MKDQKPLELLPCPFCGSEAKIKHNYCWSVICTNSECQTTSSDQIPMDEESAIKFWNTRALPSKGTPIECRKDCPPNMMYLVNKDYMKNESKGMVEKDLSIHGVHITKDGERVDPKDFYLTPKESSANKEFSSYQTEITPGLEWDATKEAEPGVQMRIDIQDIYAEKVEMGEMTEAYTQDCLKILIVDRLMKLGYAKLSAKSELVPLEFKPVYNFWLERVLWKDTTLANHINDFISKFGTPKPSVPSEESLADIVRPFLFGYSQGPNPTPKIVKAVREFLLTEKP